LYFHIIKILRLSHLIYLYNNLGVKMVKSVEELLELAEALVITKGKKPLSYIHKVILKEAL